MARFNAKSSWRAEGDALIKSIDFVRTKVEEDLSEIANRAADAFIERATEEGFGFKDRTHTLRSSLQRRMTGDANKAKLTVTAPVRYAGWVEWKPRTKDLRAGPPYWLERAWDEARSEMQAAARTQMRKTIAQAVKIVGVYRDRAGRFRKPSGGFAPKPRSGSYFDDRAFRHRDVKTGRFTKQP